VSRVPLAEAGVSDHLRRGGGARAGGSNVIGFRGASGQLASALRADPLRRRGMQTSSLLNSKFWHSEKQFLRAIDQLRGFAGHKLAPARRVELELETEHIAIELHGFALSDTNLITYRAAFLAFRASTGRFGVIYQSGAEAKLNRLE